MNRDEVVQEVYESEFPRVAGVVAVIWQLTLLVQVLAYLDDFRQPVVPVAVWLTMLVAAAWLVPRARARGLTGPQSAVAVTLAATAVLLVGLERRGHGATGSVDWSVLGTGWLLALVAVSRPAWEWVCGALAVFAIHAAVAVRVLGIQTPSLARLAATAYTLVVILVAFAAVRPMFRANARIAARGAHLASRSAAEQAAALAVHKDRRRRLAVLESEALPLLRGIGDGSLDPTAAAVQEQCAERAAKLRRVLADQAGAGAELLSEFEPVLCAASDRGVPVETQVVGDPGYVGPQVINATTAAVDRILRMLPPQPVLLTVIAAIDEVELYLIFREPWRAQAAAIDSPAPAPPVFRWRATVDVDEGGGCLEVRWPKVVHS